MLQRWLLLDANLRQERIWWAQFISTYRVIFYALIHLGVVSNLWMQIFKWLHKRNRKACHRARQECVVDFTYEDAELWQRRGNQFERRGEYGAKLLGYTYVSFKGIVCEPVPRNFCFMLCLWSVIFLDLCYLPISTHSFWGVICSIVSLPQGILQTSKWRYHDEAFLRKGIRIAWSPKQI